MDDTSTVLAVVRTCGTPGDTCTACCKTHHVIRPLGKGSETTEPGKWCTYCTIGVGCQQYSGRDTPCVSYACLYLLGETEEELRPDRSGIVADWYHTEEDPTPILRLMEYRPGAFQGPVFDHYLALGLRLNCFVLAIVPRPFERSTKEYFPPSPDAPLPKSILKIFSEQQSEDQDHDH